MKPICTPDLNEILENSNLLLDTCTIIEMLKRKDVCDLISGFAEVNCSLISIAPVVDELTYGVNNLKEYNDFLNFLSSRDILILDEARKNYPDNEIKAFRIAMSKCKKIAPSYVDRILLSIPYFYRKSSTKIYLATLNYKDVPTELYECIGMISYYTNRAFRNIGIYEFKLDWFQRMMGSVMNRLKA